MTDYDLGVIRVGDLEIICANYKISGKQSSEKIEATNSYDGIGWNHGKTEYNIECSEVYPEQFPQILELYRTKTQFTLTTFNILEDNSYVEGLTLLGCIITEFDNEMNKGEKTSFKAEALKLQE